MQQVANHFLTIMLPCKNVSNLVTLHKHLTIPNLRCRISFPLLTPALPVLAFKSLLITRMAFFCLELTFPSRQELGYG